MLTKTELFKEIQRLALQVESLEAQVRNTFNIEQKAEFQARLKYAWEKIDIMLDNYNFQQKNSPDSLTNA